MRLRCALIATMLSCLAAQAADAPGSITNARIELRTGANPTAALDQAGRGTWVGWSVPAIAKVSDICCFTDNFKRRGCSLSERNGSWGTSTDFKSPPSTELYVLVETRDGRPGRVKIASPSCPLDGADRRLVWLGEVDAGASLAALERILEANAEDGDDGDSALAAIVHHQDPRADELIQKRIFDPSLPEDARQKAVFWAGQARDRAGFRMIDRVLSSEPSGDLRQHAVFALSQSSVAEAPDRIKRVAVEDRDRDVRAHALFSLTQTHAAGSGEWIVGRLDSEKDEHVREQAVFALSQLDDGTDWLLKVLRSKRDPETVRRALFWLGQSKDPRALEEIERILDKYE